MAHEHFKSCIDACNDCALACDHCAAACLKETDVARMVRCIRLDIDCAEICRLAVAYMARGSELSADICELCASICDECAKECAKACRRCAEECRRMASEQMRKQSGQRPAAHAH